MISAALLLAKLTLVLAIAEAACRWSCNAPAVARRNVYVWALGMLAVVPFCGLRFSSYDAWQIASTATGHALPAASAHWALPALGTVWAIGAVLLAERFAAAWLRLRRCRQSARAGDPGSSNLPVLHADVTTPLLFGWLHPVILLPRSAASWSAEQLAAAVRHEEIHLANGDHWTSLLAAAMQTVYWFHPLVWMVAAKLRFEQEAICDRQVLESGTGQADYAALLLRVSQEMNAPGIFSCSVSGAPRNLKGRVMNILNYQATHSPERAGRAGFRFTVLAIAAAGLLIPVRADDMRNQAGGHAYRVGEAGVSAPLLLTKVEPDYTKAALDAKVEGAALLSVVIDKNGLPAEVTVVRSLDSGLDQNAVEAVQRWRFKPAMKDGKPVPVEAHIEVQFRIK